jgi:hypothetical protein
VQGRRNTVTRCCRVIGRWFIVDGGDGVLNLGFEVAGGRHRSIGSRIWWGDGGRLDGRRG